MHEIPYATPHGIPTLERSGASSLKFQNKSCSRCDCRRGHSTILICMDVTRRSDTGSTLAEFRDKKKHRSQECYITRCEDVQKALIELFDVPSSQSKSCSPRPSSSFPSMLRSSAPSALASTTVSATSRAWVTVSAAVCILRFLILKYLEGNADDNSLRDCLR